MGVKTRNNSYYITQNFCFICVRVTLGIYVYFPNTNYTNNTNRELSVRSVLSVFVILIS